MNDLIKIGKTLKAHGLEGELKMAVEEQYLEDFLQVRILFIEERGQPVPYFINNVRGGQLLVSLEGVINRTQAEKIAKKNILIRKEDLIPEEEKVMEVSGLEYAACIGFLMTDKEAGELGVIEDILDYPQQEMAIIRKGNKEIMIPLIDAFIREINDKDKRIFVELPEGLLNL